MKIDSFDSLFADSIFSGEDEVRKLLNIQHQDAEVSATEDSGAGGFVNYSLSGYQGQRFPIDFVLPAGCLVDESGEDVYGILILVRNGILNFVELYLLSDEPVGIATLAMKHSAETEDKIEVLLKEICS